MTDGRTLLDDLAKREVIICGGAGGVGKTTTSAALGLALAHRYGKKVLVLTVDPAKRLASALGLATLGSQPTCIDDLVAPQLNEPLRGSLFAAMLNVKDAWDQAVHRYADSPQTVRQLIANPYYQSMIETFVGSQEYAALETLFQLHASGEFDCIVVDTPPSKNALDIIEAPRHYSDFAGARLISLLTSPARVGWRAFAFAAAPVSKMASRLLGTSSLAELIDFVEGFQSMNAGIQNRARSLYALLRSTRCAFVVVTTLEDVQFGEAEMFTYRLRELGMHLRGVIINKSLPEFLGTDGMEQVVMNARNAERVFEGLPDKLKDACSLEAVETVAEMIQLLHDRAVLERKLKSSVAHLGRAVFVTVPLLPRDLSNIEGVVEIAKQISPQKQPQDV
ncbi:MAG: ArsA family ATPase [Candidatus Dormibacteria bacterium]